MYANKNDGKPWSSGDLEDLRACIDSGLTIAETATALSREGTIEDVLSTAEAQGWKFEQGGAKSLNGSRHPDQAVE
jgi:hypothetical protein